MTARDTLASPAALAGSGVADSGGAARGVADQGQAGRIDTFIGTSSEADRLITDLGLDGRFCKWQLPDARSGHSHFALSRQSDKWFLHERLTEVLQRLLANGRVEALIQSGLRTHE